MFLPEQTQLGRLRILEVYHYFDGPRLFSCVNTSGQIFLVFWLGDEQDMDRWLYVPLSDTRLKTIRSGRLSLRDTCMDPEDGWLWLVSIPLKSNDAIAVESIRPLQLTSADLPAVESFLSIDTQTLPPIEESISLRAQRAKCDVLDLALSPEGAHRNEVAARTLGSMLVNVQNLVDSVVFSNAGYKSRQGRPPANLREVGQLQAVGAFASSFGIRLEAKMLSNLLGESALSPALLSVISLINAGADSNQLKELLTALGGRVAAHFTVFLTALKNNATDMKMVWASPQYADKSETVELPWRSAAETIAVLLETIPEIAETFRIPCRLDGIDLYTKKFDLVNLETNERLSGRVLDSYISAARKAAAKVPSEYIATIEQHQEINATTGEVKEKYSLVLLEER